MDFDKKEQLERIASNVIGDCDYCVWLCASPEDIFSYYVKEYIPKAERIQPGYADECPDYRVKESMSLEEYSEKYVSRIVIPDNSDIRFLCDLGRAGSLVAYKREDNNSDRL